MGLLDYNIEPEKERKGLGLMPVAPIVNPNQRYIDAGRAIATERAGGSEALLYDLTDDDYMEMGRESLKEREHGMVGELGAGLGRGALRVAATPAYLADVAGEAVGWKGLERAGEFGAEKVEKFIEESPRLRKSISISGDIRDNPQLWTDPRWYLSLIGEGAPTIASMIIPSMAAAKAAQVAGLGAKGIMAARFGGAITAGMGLEAGGAAEDVRQYEERTGEQVPIGKKLKTVTGTGVVAGSLEAIPIFNIFGGVVAKKLIGRIITSMVLEGGTEGAQEIVANAFAKAGYDADRDMVGGVIESVVGGVLLGGGMGAMQQTFQERIQKTSPDEVAKLLEQAEKETIATPEEINQVKADIKSGLMAEGIKRGDLTSGMMAPVIERVAIQDPALAKQITDMFAIKETDLTENERRFEEDPLDAANNAEYLDKYIKRAALPEGMALTDEEIIPVGVEKKSVEFIGMQERVGKPPFPLVNELDTMSTVAYDPAKHEMTNLPEYEKAVAAEKVEKAEVKEPWKTDTKLESREYQEKYPERTVHMDWNLANSPRHDFEGAGDILREFQKKDQDPHYISEKLGRIKRFVDGHLNNTLHFDDSLDAAIKHEPKKLNRLISQYESQPVSTESQKTAKSLILNIMKGNFKEAQKNLETIEESVAGWTEQGLKPLPPKLPEAKPPLPPTEEIKAEAIPEVKPKVEKEKAKLDLTKRYVEETGEKIKEGEAYKVKEKYPEEWAIADKAEKDKKSLWDKLPEEFRHNRGINEYTTKELKDMVAWENLTLDEFEKIPLKERGQYPQLPKSVREERLETERWAEEQEQKKKEAKAKRAEKKAKLEKPTGVEALRAEYGVAEPFYSQVVKTVQDKMPAKMQASAVMNWLKKQPGIKPAEFEWMNIEEMLEGKKVVTKGELVKLLRENEVRVEEVVKSADRQKLSDRIDEIDGLLQEEGISKTEEKRLNAEYDRLHAKYKRLYEDTGISILADTKFAQWQLPGEKENYREFLFKLPDRQPIPVGKIKVEEKERSYIVSLGQHKVEVGKAIVDNEKAAIEYAKPLIIEKEISAVEGRTFKGVHWDEPNVFAHARVNERTDADGNKVLFIEEIQSDWALKGRREGYGKPLSEKEKQRLILLSKKFVERDELSSGEFDEYSELAKRSAGALAPDMPFKKNWHEVVLKRIVRMAAEQGIDKVAWVTGQQTADRYDLSKQVDRVEWTIPSPGKYNIGAYPIGEERFPEHLGREDLTIDEVAGFVGKTIADKIQVQEKAGVEEGEFSGEDLKIGAEWAYHLYDKMIPQYLKKFGKKWGAEVGAVEIEIGGERIGKYVGPELDTGDLNAIPDQDLNATQRGQIYDVGSAMEEDGLSFKKAMEKYGSRGLAEIVGGKFDARKKAVSVQAFTITPELKQIAIQEGFPIMANKEAYGSQEKADAAVESVAKEAQAVSAKSVPDRIRVAESNVIKELKSKKRVDFTGRQLTKGNESQEIAEMFQVYRSPKLEILHTIYTDKAGTILGHNAMTSGQIDAVSPKDMSQYIYKMKSAAKRLGADKVHVLHNHPAGDPTMSSPDIRFADKIREGMGALTGEFVVIDHGKFTSIPVVGDSLGLIKYGEFKPLPTIKDWTEGKTIVSNESDVAAFGKNLAYDNNKAVFIYLNDNNEVQGWTVHNKRILAKGNVALRKSIQQQIKAHNSTRAVLIADSPVLLKRIVMGRAVGGWLVDVQDTKGNSLRDQFPSSFEVDRDVTKQAWGLFEPKVEYGEPTADYKAMLKRYQEAETKKAKSKVDSLGKVTLDKQAKRGSIDTQEITDSPGSPEGWNIPSESKGRQVLDTIQWKMQDRLIHLKKAQTAIEAEKTIELPDSSNVYQTEELYHYKTTKRINDADFDLFDPLTESIHKSKHDLEDVELFLRARHAPEANKRLQEINPKRPDNESLSGMSNEEASGIMEQYGKDVSMLNIAKQIDTITKATRQTMVSDGLATPNQIKAWEDAYKYYIPLKREGKGSEMPKKGRGMYVGGKESKMRLTGSAELKPINIIANIMAQHESTIIRAEKAKVGRAMFELAKEHPNKDFWVADAPELKTFLKQRKDDASQLDLFTGLPGSLSEVVYGRDILYKFADNVLVTKIDGIEHTITFNDKNVHSQRTVRALKNLGADNSNGVLNVLSKVNRVLAMVNTSLNPEFIISNFTRDIQTAGYNINDTQAKGVKAKIFRDVFKALHGIRHGIRGKYDTEWAKIYEDFEKSGAQTGWIDYYKNIEAREKTLKKKLSMMKEGAWPTMQRTMKSVFDFISNENTAVENAIRLSAYKHLKGLGLSDSKSASTAKNLTVNFNRKGDAGQALNSLYLFFNANAQGSVRLIYAASRSRIVRKMMLGTVGFAVMLDILNRAVGGDDDDGEKRYDKVPVWVKEHNMVIMRSNGDYFKIPLPWGYNTLHVLGQIIGESVDPNYQKKFSPIASAGRLGGAVLASFNPLGSENSLLQIISPTVIDPFIQWAENKNFAGIPLRPEQNPFDVPKPEYQMYFRNAREPSKWMAKKLNDLTGGDVNKPGLVDVSPEVFDLFIDTFTGGAGKFIDNTLRIPKTLTEKDIDVRHIPFVRRAYGEPSEFAMRTKFYDNQNEIRYAEKSVKHYKDVRNFEELKKTREVNKVELRFVDRAKAAKKNVKDLRSDQKRVEGSKLSKEIKEKRIERIEWRIQQTINRFNKQYFDAKHRR